MQTSMRHIRTVMVLALLVAGLGVYLLTPSGRPVAAQSPTPAASGAGSSVARDVSHFFGGASAPATALQPAAAPGLESRGPGDFDLTYPAAGLETLPGYRAQMQVTLEATNNGAPIQESESFTETASAAPAAYLLWTDTGAGRYMEAEVGGVRYTRLDGRCRAEAVTGDEQREFVPLAAALPPVLGAEEAGAPETMQGIPTRHYRFDARALNLSGLTDAAGEVWVAAQGNFVVKYLLRAEGQSSEPGQTWTATKTWTYELSDVSGVSSIELPADCPPGLTGAPLPNDAADVIQRVGYTRFATGLSPKDVAAFYEQGLPGWEPVGDQFADAQQAILMFSQEDLRLTISARAGPPTTVAIFLSRAESPPTAR